ncbi:CatB-related O-acetyltransferase [Ectopseudomonas mendocina]|uniref:CatB-related O-acetyltransferase n=1 Tax=Ectopseudomonas mendocina TaxID=300 RepID=A0ABZ2RDZ0_ECTME
MGWFSRFKQKRQKKEIRRLPKFLRGAAKFLQRYPDYEIGVGTYGLPLVHDWKEGSTLRIGRYTSIAENVEIFLGGHHRPDWITTYPFPVMFDEAKDVVDYAVSRGDVVIGSDVWLCTNCMILSGVTIGHGAVVAAGAVVTKDVAPYSIVAGNPAQHVRWRFAPDLCEQLLQTAWWDWPEQELREISPLLCSDRLDDFLRYARARES